MSLKANLAVLCDNASLDTNSKISVNGIFENIFSDSFPYVHPQLFVVVSVPITESGQYNTTISLKKDENKNEIASMKLIHTISEPVADQGKILIVGRFVNITLSEEGSYSFYVVVNGEDIVRLPLKVLHS